MKASVEVHEVCKLHRVGLGTCSEGTLIEDGTCSEVDEILASLPAHSSSHRQASFLMLRSSSFVA